MTVQGTSPSKEAVVCKLGNTDNHVASHVNNSGSEVIDSELVSKYCPFFHLVVVLFLLATH